MIFLCVFIGSVFVIVSFLGSIYFALWLEEQLEWSGILFLILFYSSVISGIYQVTENDSNKIKETKIENVVDKCEK